MVGPRVFPCGMRVQCGDKPSQPLGVNTAIDVGTDLVEQPPDLRVLDPQGLGFRSLIGGQDEVLLASHVLAQLGLDRSPASRERARILYERRGDQPFAVRLERVMTSDRRRRHHRSARRRTSTIAVNTVIARYMKNP